MKKLFTLLASIFFINIGISQSGKIDVNNINITINPSNVMFQTLSPDTNTYFEVPKGSGKSRIFSSSFLMAGIRDSDSVLCGSRQSYKHRSYKNSFSAGPLSVVLGSGTGGRKDYGPATITNTQKALWNKVFCVNKWDIDIFLRWYRCDQDPACNTFVSFPGYTIPSSIMDWPAHGDILLLQDYYLAPFYDENSDGNYNPLDGDYPCIKGDQYCWYIINDRGEDTSRNEMGIEIHTEVYSFKSDSTNPLYNTVFIGRDIINRSTESYRNFIASQFTDFESHFESIGSMPSTNSYYTYSFTNNDSLYNGYGISPPAQGLTFLNKPMKSSVVFINTSSVFGDSKNITEAYNHMNGKWRDGSPVYYNFTSSSISNHMYPYIAPSGFSIWRDTMTFFDKRVLGSSSPSSLAPGDLYKIDMAYVFSRSDSGHLKSVDKLYRDIQKVQTFYNDSIPTTCQAFALSIPEKNTINASVFPNPTTNSFTIETNDVNSRADILSVDGKIIAKSLELHKSTQIDASSWENGLYLVRIYNEEGKFKVLRVVKN